MARTLVSNRTEVQNYTNSIQFLDSASQRITCPGAANYTTSIISNFTILTYVRLRAPTSSAGTNHALCSNNAGAFSNNFWFGVNKPARTMFASITDGVGIQTLTSTATIANGWHWIGMSYQAGVSLNIYIDTTIETVAPTKTAVADSTRALSIGSTNANTFIHGNMARFWIFGGQITAQELKRVVYAGDIPASLTKALIWNMADGSGVITDASGNANTGTLSSATWSTDVPLKSRTIATSRTLVSSRTTI